MSVNTASKLEKILSEGHYAVTSECGPPRGSKPEPIVEKADHAVFVAEMESGDIVGWIHASIASYLMAEPFELGGVIADSVMLQLELELANSTYLTQRTYRHNKSASEPDVVSRAGWTRR